MATNQAISDFQRSCQKYFACYCICECGLLNFASKFEELLPDDKKKLHFGTGHPDEGTWHATINIREVIEKSKPQGEFSNTIAKSFIVAIFSEWDEVYRQRAASEAGVKPQCLKCDLMGDLRMIRHCIVHNKAIIRYEHEKLKELRWPLSPGILTVTQDMFSTLVDQINRMTVRVEPEPPRDR